MVEFTDFACPYCKRFHAEAFAELKKNYIDTGKLRFYSINFPLDIHPDAARAAQAARCASDQGQFWGMHDRMIESARLDLDSLSGYAKDLGMDSAVLRSCVESGKYNDDVRKTAFEAMNKGIDGTPAFAIGRSTPTGVQGEIVVGARPYAFFDEKLKELER
jgi:protein-disulfide isomerase